jgi:YVTN family beta-propeller protein
MKRMFNFGLKGQGSIVARRIPTAPRRLAMLALAGFAGHAQAVFDHATYSSSIALSADNQLVWSVNPGDDSVSVIRTDTDQVITKIRVGNEPQSVALDPDNKYAYVANAAAGTVTLIKINNPDPDSFRARVKRTIRTGAEPWNIVVSPDGRRVFVANSGQDTVTVIDGLRREVIGHVNLRNSLCNDPDRNRHFQPRGLAVTEDNSKLYVTRFFSFVKTGGKQGDDLGKEGLVCRLDINTNSRRIRDYKPAQAIPLAAQVTGFEFPGRPGATSAFPNQLQSIVLRGDQAYLPNIAASPTGPLRFNVDTQAFVNVIDGVNAGQQTDSAGKFINLHLGARAPEPGKKRLFFANPWAMAFTTQSGEGSAYVVSAGSDLLVKVDVAADGRLSNTVDADTTRYIDLNDPANPATSGDNAGKNPQGIVITDDGAKAYVMNFVSRNVSVVDLTDEPESVVKTIRTADLPPPGSADEVRIIGAEQFFSSRGHYNPVDSRGAPHTVSTDERLSSEGWQACSSCHFKGLTDAVVWKFETGPRKSIPLNATWNPRDRGDPGQSNGDQRILNYSAVRDEVEDFELNARNISGPGNLAQATNCSEPPPAQSTFDPDHGLFLGDVDPDEPPCVINNFDKPNTDRNQVTVTLPGRSTAVPAETALREWVRFAVRTPSGPLNQDQITGGVSSLRIARGRQLFQRAGCDTCHGGGNWTISTRDFTPPPNAGLLFTERNPSPQAGNPVGAQFLAGVLRDVGSFNLGVTGGEPFLPNRPFGNNIGAEEKIGNLAPNGVFQDGLGFDYNGDGQGSGFNVPSLLGIHASPPYLHNGACETLACVVSDVNHRTALGTRPDVLSNPRNQALVVLFLESITDKTRPFPLPSQ